MTRSTSFELMLPQADTDTPAYRWLYSAIREQILKRQLRPGTRLPATRDLAKQYGLARGTIVSAFDQLKSEGYVEGSVGSGTYVSRALPEELLDVGIAGPTTAVPRRAHVALSDYGRRAELFPGYGNHATRAFRCNLPALDLFPIDLWTQVTTRCLRRTTVRSLMGCDPLGYQPLREALVEYLGRSRGVKCVPEQIAIVSGVQEALDLIGRVLLDASDRVCVENPGYPGAAFVFAALRAKVVPVELDAEGICVDRLPHKSVRLVYVTPGHQFPLGMTMSLRRRLQLLEWARKSGAMILEDDYDGEYRFSGRPVPALQGLDNRGQVIYAGSFSKVLFPALRLGYVVIPKNLMSRIEAVKSLANRHAPVLEQVVVDRFIRDGRFARHIRRMRTIYAERMSALTEEVRAHLSGLLELSRVEAGLQTTGWLGEGLDGESATAAAQKRGVEVMPLSIYDAKNGSKNILHIGFAAIHPREIRRGVKELAAALEGELRRQRSVRK